MWSRKHSVCSAVSCNSRIEDEALPGVHLYPFAIALRVRVMQIVCGIAGLVVGAVGWLEERERVALGLGVPAGAITVIAAATSVYFSRGFGGWASARSRATSDWGPPWRALGPSRCAAIPITILWICALSAHIAMLVFCLRSLLNIGCGSTTCVGVAAAQLSVSVATLCAAVYMVFLDLKYDASLSPHPQHSEAQNYTGVSMVTMVPLPFNAVSSGTGDTTSNATNSPPRSNKSEPQNQTT